MVPNILDQKPSIGKITPGWQQVRYEGKALSTE
jgi:hypothetical protein